MHEEKQEINFDLESDKLVIDDVYKMLHIEKSKSIQQNREYQ